ncbi:MAG TPA: hypothetical protein VM597_36400, partial [Gemmataceae bacterium]|nr:hypothetical protein [Gemmataceae bacterium]
AVEAVARAVAFGPTGRPAHPAGGLLVDLTADYAGNDRFEVASDDRAVSFALDRNPAPTPRAAVPVGPRLATGPVAAATLEGGRSVRYELPARAPGGTVPPAATARSFEVGPAPAPEAPAAAGPVGGVPVKVTVTGPAAGPDAQKLADDLLKALQAAPR